jgi:hypothetical protein
MTNDKSTRAAGKRRGTGFSGEKARKLPPYFLIRLYSRAKTSDLS